MSPARCSTASRSLRADQIRWRGSARSARVRRRAGLGASERRTSGDSHPRQGNPLRKSFTGMKWYPVNEAYRRRDVRLTTSRKRFRCRTCWATSHDDQPGDGLVFARRQTMHGGCDRERHGVLVHLSRSDEQRRDVSGGPVPLRRGRSTARCHSISIRPKILPARSTRTRRARCRRRRTDSRCALKRARRSTSSIEARLADRARSGARGRAGHGSARDVAHSRPRLLRRLSLGLHRSR